MNQGETIVCDTTPPISDICDDFRMIRNGEVSSLLIPQSRRERHLLAAVREAGDTCGDPILMTSGQALCCLVDENDTPIHEGLFFCLLIDMGGNRTTFALLKEPNFLFVAPQYQPEIIQWLDGEPDWKGMLELVQKRSEERRVG